MRISAVTTGSAHQGTEINIFPNLLLKVDPPRNPSLSAYLDAGTAMHHARHASIGEYRLGGSEEFHRSSSPYEM
jgi:hypothetical protein